MTDLPPLDEAVQPHCAARITLHLHTAVYPAVPTRAAAANALASCPCTPLPAVLYFSIGSSFLPGHSAWATLLLWASSQIGALVAWQLRLPRVIGMLCAGLLMKNIPWSAVDAFNPRWGVQMRAAALATIFLRYVLAWGAPGYGQLRCYLCMRLDEQWSWW